MDEQNRTEKENKVERGASVSLPLVVEKTLSVGRTVKQDLQ